MCEQTVEHHPLDRHVLLSQNIEDIHRLHPAIPDHYKAIIIPNVADAQMKHDLLSIRNDAAHLNRKLAAFLNPLDAPESIKDSFSPSTIETLSAISLQFARAASGQDTSIFFIKNLGRTLPSSLRLHYEGVNPTGPSMRRDFRGNLSVSLDDRAQMKWVPTDALSVDDIKLLLLEKRTGEKPSYHQEFIGSGDLCVLHGLSNTFSDYHKHGLIHVGPEKHDRVTVLWGINHTI